MQVQMYFWDGIVQRKQSVVKTALLPDEQIRAVAFAAADVYCLPGAERIDRSQKIAPFGSFLDCRPAFERSYIHDFLP